MRRVKQPTENATAARRARGEETRLRILRAADTEFAEAGYQAATMARIAARSGVAVQTVYFNFRSKSLLLRELIRQSVMGFSNPQKPEDTDWFAAILVRGDGYTALRAFAVGSLGIFRRASIAAETARLAAPTDPGVAEVYDESERLRAEQFARIAGSLEQHHGLREGITAQKATDILLTMASAQTYLQLTRLRGWSDDEWAKWLGEALCRLLLP
ncbi:MAG: TetR/AcrR family transcriptional regulator [Candidatus Dormibacteraceae bacterium]